MVAQRPLGTRARGDVDDGADQPGDLAVRIGIGRLVVDGVVQLAVARPYRDLVALPAGIGIELAVHRGVFLGDGRVARVEIGDLLADEGIGANGEKLFPRPIHAEIAAVAALEKYRHREGIDQLEGCVERCCCLILPPCPFYWSRLGHGRGHSNA